MNREHAETHLRLLAEEELRRAATRPAGSASGSRPEDEAVPSASGHLARVDKVARALTAVSALDAEVADQLLEDFGLALGARQAGSRGRRGAGLGSWMRSPAVGPWAAAPRSGTETAAGLAHAPGPAGPGATPGRVVRLGQVIPVRGEDVSGEVYLLSYAQRSSGPQFSLFARARLQAGPPGPRHPGPAVLSAARSGPSPFQQWPGVAGLEQFTATDDRGTRYQMMVRDLGGGTDGWTLMLAPSPPHDPRWLDLITAPGQPSVRVDLDRSARPPPDATVTAGPVTASPGDHVLRAVAARLLAKDDLFVQTIS